MYMYEAFTLLRVLLGHEGAVIPATRSNIGLRLGIKVTVYGANRRDIVEFEADSTFSTKGKLFLLYRNFEYVKERHNVNGSTSWRCCYYQSLKCKARLLSHGSRVVEDRQPDHTHDGNMSESLTRLKRQWSTPSAARGRVMTNLVCDFM